MTLQLPAKWVWDYVCRPTAQSLQCFLEILQLRRNMTCSSAVMNAVCLSPNAIHRSCLIYLLILRVVNNWFLRYSLTWSKQLLYWSTDIAGSISLEKQKPNKLQCPLFLPLRKRHSPPQRVMYKARKSRGCRKWEEQETTSTTNTLLLQYIRQLHLSKTLRKEKSCLSSLQGACQSQHTPGPTRLQRIPSGAGLSLHIHEDNQLSFFH